MRHARSLSYYSRPRPRRSLSLLQAALVDPATKGVVPIISHALSHYSRSRLHRSFSPLRAALVGQSMNQERARGRLRRAPSSLLVGRAFPCTAMRAPRSACCSSPSRTVTSCRLILSTATSLSFLASSHVRLFLAGGPSPPLLRVHHPRSRDTSDRSTPARIARLESSSNLAWTVVSGLGSSFSVSAFSVSAPQRVPIERIDDHGDAEDGGSSDAPIVSLLAGDSRPSDGPASTSSGSFSAVSSSESSSVGSTGSSFKSKSSARIAFIRSSLASISAVTNTATVAAQSNTPMVVAATDFSNTPTIRSKSTNTCVGARHHNTTHDLACSRIISHEIIML